MGKMNGANYSAPPSQALANHHMDASMNPSRAINVETEIERLKLDMARQQQNDKIRQEEMENFFKRASVEYFNRLQDTSKRLDSIKGEQAGSNNLTNIVAILEQEIIDLKN